MPDETIYEFGKASDDALEYPRMISLAVTSAAYGGLHALLVWRGAIFDVHIANSLEDIRTYYHWLRVHVGFPHSCYLLFWST